MKIKNLILGVLLVCGLLAVAGGLPAQAITDVTPANSALNPVTETLYVVNNAAPSIKVYARTTGGWDDAGISPIALPSGSKCYGLAVAANGAKLYISINAAAASAIRVYDLNPLNGIPTGSSVDMTGVTWGSTSSPKGMALGGENKLYVVDNARIRVFDTSTNAWVSNITRAGITTLYDVAVTPGTSSYKIYVSRRSEPGAIYAYSYSSGTITSLSTIEGLSYPTYLKVAGSKLYAAVNSASGVDIKVYNTADDTLAGDVRSGIVGSYGWNAFDVSADNTWLIFKKAKNSIETSNGLYKIRTADIAGSVIAEEIPSDILFPLGGGPLNKADGFKIALDSSRGALSNSPNGNVQVVHLFAGNLAPSISNLKQYRLDGTTEIAKGGTTNENKIIVEFTVSDPDGEPVVTKAIWAALGVIPGTTVTGETLVSGSGTVRITIPASPETFADGSFEWAAEADDGHGHDMVLSYGSDGLPMPGGTADLIVDTTNDPPNTFSKVSPSNGVDECCDVSLNWENNGDPDVLDTLTYSVEVFRAGDYTTPVYSQGGITVNTRAIPLGTLTVGQTYEWNVSATDGTNTVWANGARDARWSFNYILGNEVEGDPYITSTVPSNGATAVNVTEPIVVRFNESILASSLSLTATPAINITGREWNADHTQVILRHDSLTADTAYNVTIAATDLLGHALNNADPASAPNPFSFTTGSSTGEPIVNIEVTREGDNPGDDVIVTWDTDPAGLGVDIYELVCNTDSNGDYTSYFTTSASVWGAPIVTNNTSGTYTIPSSVGTGTAQYYKLVPTGHTLVDHDLTTDVVGKFDLAVGPSETNPNKFFISVPLELSDSSLAAVIGGQVSEMDMILSFDINKDVTNGSIYMTGAWGTFPGATGPIATVDAGYTYGYYSPSSKFITVVGRIRETSLVRTLDGGPTPAANWLANPYPMPVEIANAGLNSSSYSASNPTQAGTIYLFDANAELIGGTAGIAFHTDASVWMDGTLAAPSTLQLVPGKGYMFTEPVQSTFDWNISKPY